MTTSEQRNFPLGHLSGFGGRNDPPQRLHPISGSPYTPGSHANAGKLECTCLTPLSCSYKLHLICLFNLCQVSQGKNFLKPFPPAPKSRLSLEPPTRGSRKRRLRWRETSDSLCKLNLRIADPRPQPRARTSPLHFPRSIPRPHGTLTCGKASRAPPRSSLPARPPRASLRAGCQERPRGLAGTAGRLRAGRRDAGSRREECSRAGPRRARASGRAGREGPFVTEQTLPPPLTRGGRGRAVR